MKFEQILATVAAVALGGTIAFASPEAYDSCQDSCYQAKSRAYQRCRSIPPADRAARDRCFRKADAALERCLSRCG